MKTLAFLSQKGGSGKTTLSVHTAVAAAEEGERVAVIDTDPQKSATSWAGVRDQDTPVVATAAVSELDGVMNAARHDAMTLIIIDAAPHAAPAASRVAQVADLVVIPVRPTALDLAAVGNAVDIVKAAKAKSVFVLSACPFRSPEIAEARTVLGEYGLPVSPVEIIDRRAFARAISTGRAVTEFEGEGKAAFEIRSLWQWLKGQL